MKLLIKTVWSDSHLSIDPFRQLRNNITSQVNFEVLLFVDEYSRNVWNEIEEASAQYLYEIIK